MKNIIKLLSYVILSLIASILAILFNAYIKIGYVNFSALTIDRIIASMVITLIFVIIINYKKIYRQFKKW